MNTWLAVKNTKTVKIFTPHTEMRDQISPTSLKANGLFFLPLEVVTQSYDCYVNQAHVIKGNDALVKCDIPSFVTDFVSVFNWQDTEDNIFSTNSLTDG